VSEEKSLKKIHLALIGKNSNMRLNYHVWIYFFDIIPCLYFYYISFLFFFMKFCDEVFRH